ncbi:hypothetical protein [Halegenticoccus soli]|uniref:hypothetical protein n=1 Tax=Halegenticoccus soli TaxID=1985678 RepID=UPI0018EAA986|nr:hypothetical protein [Halegenticoccus soli]
MPDDDKPGEAAVEDQLRQAHQALADAEGARNANLSDAVVINRLYYAVSMLHKPFWTTAATTPVPTEAFSPSSGPRSSSLATRGVRTDAS